MAYHKSYHRGVGSIARQEYADMHLVGFGFQPVKKTLHAIPITRLIDFLKFLRSDLHGLAISVVNPFLFGIGEIFPWCFDIDAEFLAATKQVSQALVPAFALKGFDRAASDGEGRIRNGFAEIKTDDASKAPAHGTGAKGRVEREQCRSWRTQSKTGDGVGPRSRERLRDFGWWMMDGGVAFAEAEGSLEGFENAHPVFASYQGSKPAFGIGNIIGRMDAP